MSNSPMVQRGPTISGEVDFPFVLLQCTDKSVQTQVEHLMRQLTGMHTANNLFPDLISIPCLIDGLQNIISPTQVTPHCGFATSGQALEFMCMSPTLLNDLGNHIKEGMSWFKNLLSPSFTLSSVASESVGRSSTPSCKVPSSSVWTLGVAGGGAITELPAGNVATTVLGTLSSLVRVPPVAFRFFNVSSSAALALAEILGTSAKHQVS
ncbi:uncharacterized protein EDB91DRAFT_1084089 [Suillus paluster]|uniref:uncharacterized protein n=1 Tax=Suillus paluster TaxID=48578 RepID=UPI001B885E4F|nr:uncharacterized protein EDB91DRAFT_1084089 [Suillus paluster]KAG1734435.1 hypothetical protein EDB91DRAFT_1084089 [Suillus paluster]